MRIGFIRNWSWAKRLNVLGLTLGMVGVVFLFIWGPPQPSFEQGVAIGLENATPLPDGRTVAQYNADQATDEKHYRLMSLIGLGLVFVGFACQLVAAIMANEDKKARSEKENHERKRSMTTTDIFMIVFTGVIAITGTLGAIIFNGQLKTMQGQLEEMKETGKQTATLIDTNSKLAGAAQKSADIAERALIASQRAWINADVAITGPLVFDHNGVSTSIGFRMTNTGNLPAINVTGNAILVVAKQDGPFPLQVQKEMCEKIRNQPFDLGHTIFPGETFPANVGVSTWSVGVNVGPEDIKKAMAVSGNGKYISLYVVGCVDYTFPTDPDKHHQTAFIYDVHHNLAVGVGPLIAPDAGNISAENLTLFKFSIGTLPAAD